MDNNSSSSVGTLQEMGNYKAYIPNYLDNDIDLNDKRTCKLLEEASVAIGTLNGLCKRIPYINTFINMHVFLEAISSNEIEGTKTDIKDLMDATRKEEGETDAEKRDRQEVLNLHRVTYEYFNNKQDKNKKLSIKTLEQISTNMFKDIKPENKYAKKIRTVQNYIGGTNIMDAQFIPPPPDKVTDLLENLNDFWYEKALYTPNLIKIAVYHLQFETIHPFVDGNGRIGRLLIHLQLKETGLLDWPILCLSKHWKKHRGLYYDALSAARFSNNREHWIRFFLNSIKEASLERIETIQKIDELYTTYRKKIEEEYKSNKNYLDLLNYLLRLCPFVTVNLVREMLKLSYQGADKVVKNFVNLGILKEDKKTKRNRSFVFEEYNNLVFQPAQKSE